MQEEPNQCGSCNRATSRYAWWPTVDKFWLSAQTSRVLVVALSLALVLLCVEPTDRLEDLGENNYNEQKRAVLHELMLRQPARLKSSSLIHLQGLREETAEEKVMAEVMEKARAEVAEEKMARATSITSIVSEKSTNAVAKAVLAPVPNQVENEMVGNNTKRPADFSNATVPSFVTVTAQHAESSILLPRHTAVKQLSSPASAIHPNTPVKAVSYRSRPLAEFLPSDSGVRQGFESAAKAGHPLHPLHPVVDPMREKDSAVMVQLGLMLWIAVCVFAVMSCVSTLRNHVKQRDKVKLLQHLAQLQSDRELGKISSEECKREQERLLSTLNSRPLNAASPVQSTSVSSDKYQGRLRSRPGLSATQLGLVLFESDDDASGLIIRTVKQGSAAGLSRDIHAGDRLLSIDGRSTFDMDEEERGGLATRLLDVAIICLVIRRNGRQEAVVLQPAVHPFVTATQSATETHDADGFVAAAVQNWPVAVEAQSVECLTSVDTLLQSTSAPTPTSRTVLAKNMQHDHDLEELKSDESSARSAAVKHVSGQDKHIWEHITTTSATQTIEEEKFPQQVSISQQDGGQIDDWFKLRVPGWNWGTQKSKKEKEKDSSRSHPPRIHEYVCIDVGVGWVEQDTETNIPAGCSNSARQEDEIAQQQDVPHKSAPCNSYFQLLTAHMTEYRDKQRDKRRSYGATSQPPASSSTDEGLLSNSWPNLPVPTVEPSPQVLASSSWWECLRLGENSALVRLPKSASVRFKKDMQQPAVRAALALILLLASVCVAALLAPVALVKAVAVLLSGCAASVMVTFFSNFMISGNARGATADSIQLGLDASDQDGNYIDWLVSITDGCGSGQTRRISGYDALTKTLVISKPWQCDPDLTSTYVLYVDPWLNPISIFEHINSQHVPLEAPSLTRSDREQSNSKCLRQGVTKARVRTEEEKEHTEIRKYVSIVESLSGSATSCDGRRRQCRSDFAERHFTLPRPSYRPPSPPRGLFV